MLGKGADKLKSFLGTESEFLGDLTVNGILKMDGSVTGKIQADQVILSDTAFIKGEVIAGKIYVGGRVEGILRAAELVEIQAKGKVTGEILTKKFLVQEGGEFNGKIEMKINGNNEF
jgi:cytoskeletal protein CcmA (bactofilin family)